MGAPFAPQSSARGKILCNRFIKLSFKGKRVVTIGTVATRQRCQRGHEQAPCPFLTGEMS